MMKQKPILFLLFFAFIATGISQRQGNQPLPVKKSGGGTHPKNVSLAITCPNGVFVQVDASCQATVITPTPTSSCNITFMSYSIGGGPVRLVTPTGSIYPANINLGVYSASTFDVVWFVIDDCAASATCTQTIFVQDLIAPEIGCPEDISVGNSSGSTFGLTQISIDSPKVSDNCTLPVDIGLINDFNQSANASGGYPVGQTQVCWTATDQTGNTTSCCMTVTVLDDTEPVLSCPDTITVDCEAPSPFEYFLYFQNGGGNATDETALDTSSFSWVRDSVQTGQCLFEKTIRRYYTVSDSAGNADTCFQVIFVQDTIPPVAFCRDVTVYVDDRGIATTDLSLLNENSFDACSDTLFISADNALQFTCENIPEAISVSVTFTDECGNFSHCQSIITVADTISPFIECPPDLSIMPDAGSCSATGIFLGAPDPSDNCLLASIIPYLGDAEVFESTEFPAAVNQVVWIVTDQSGNSGSCTQLVTVVDSEPPVVTCPQNITVSADPGQCHAIVQYASPSGEDNCSTVSFELNKGLQSGSAFPVGSTENMFIGSDQNLNKDTCSFFVTVIDNQPPQIACPANLTLSATIGDCGRVVSFTAPVGTDNCPGAITTRITTQPSGTFFPVGLHNIVYQVTAANSMTASCSFSILVNDNQLPSITCPVNITVNSQPGQCGSTVNYTAPVGTDNCPGSTTSLFSGLTGGSFFNAGITTNVFRVTDASGNSVACQFTVTVTDNVAPQISCPSNLSVNSQTNQCGAVVNFSTPEGTDNCPGVSTSQVSGQVSGSFFPVGSTVNVFRVTAANGVTASCSFSVVVSDAQAPTILCPPNVTVNALSGQCGASATYAIPSAGDNCPGFTAARTSGPASGSFFNVGSTPITYTVTAANGATAACIFTVNVIDNQAPTVTCPSNRDVTLSSNCSIQAPDLTALVIRADNCGATTISQSPLPGTTIASANNMQHTLIMTVTDQNSRTSTCSVVLTAQDLTGPQLTCAPTDTIVISDIQSLPVTTLYTSVSDNCGGIVTVQVRRSGTVCGGSSQDVFGTAAQFCCEDVSKNIILTVRATDQRGNSATCNTTIRVEDTTDPVILEGLPDITISCKFPVNVKNLDVFGTLVDSPLKRKPILIQDEFYPSGIAGQDGVFSDNCTGTVVGYTVSNQLNACKTGTLIRTFIVRDRGNNTDTIVQRIQIINTDPFSTEDITWPSYSVEYNQCNDDDPDTAITGAPVARTSFCDQVAATYKDQTFLHPTHCKYVKRTWTVIDWCQYKTNTPNTPGKWTFIQHIYVTNSVAPTISNKVCKDTIVCIQDNSCLAKLSLQAMGTDDCLPVNIRWSYTVDVNNDGGIPEISGNGDRIAGDFQQGNYRVVWTAKDGCSNQSQCSFVFSVRDCKKPVAFAKQGLAVSVSAFTGTVSIQAKDFDNLSSDNCTPASLLKFSFSKNTGHTSMTMNCDSVGRRKIYFWVTDLAGNQSVVETFITVQDNHRYCGGNTGGRMTISGHIFTEEKMMMPNAEINLRAIEVESGGMTNQEGQFSFTDLLADRNYQIHPDKKTDMLKGISTLDLVMIQRHVLGLSYLESPYKLIAADVNGSGTITASDIVELRKLMLGVQAKFTKNDPWRFVEAEYKFDKENIWQYASSKELMPQPSGEGIADFVIIKTGDVNGSVSQQTIGKAETRSSDVVIFQIPDQYIIAGSTVRIPVYGKEIHGILGFQATVELKNGIRVTGVTPGLAQLDDSHFRIEEEAGQSRLMISYHTLKPFETNDKEALFYLELEASSAVWLGKSMKKGENLPALAIGQDLTEQQISFMILPSDNQIEGLSNSPNPFTEQTMLELTSEEDTNAEVHLFDSAGNLIRTFTYSVEKGQNQIFLSEEHFGKTKGVIICRTTIGKRSGTVKLIRMQ